MNSNNLEGPSSDALNISKSNNLTAASKFFNKSLMFGGGFGGSSFSSTSPGAGFFGAPSGNPGFSFGASNGSSLFGHLLAPTSSVGGTFGSSSIGTGVFRAPCATTGFSFGAPNFKGFGVSATHEEDYYAAQQSIISREQTERLVQKALHRCNLLRKKS